MRPQFRASNPKTTSNYEVHTAPAVAEKPVIYAENPKRSAFSLLALLFLILISCWAVYHYQFDRMPMSVSVSQAGRRGFSEEAAMKHVKALTKFGPHPVGSNALDLAVQYVLEVSNEIKKTAHWEVDVQVDFFHIRSGVNTLVGGLFSGKTLVYADLSHIVLRILPQYASDAGENAVLVSSHIDTVFSASGAGDCSSCVAVMLELARAVSHWAHGFKNGVIFLFNTGEEEGLNGAHSFITQHPWSNSVSVAIDLEAIGIGGKSSIFQAGPVPWAVENYAMVAKYPSGQALSQDIFSSGVIKSATDFQVYREVAGLSGIDFAYMDRTAVYHTKNDRLEFLTPGSFQHLGENMLAFLVHAGTSSELQKLRSTAKDGISGHDCAVYFDVLGKYMIVFRQRFATILYSSVIVQTLLIWCMSLLTGGYRAVVSLGLSVFTIFLMWTFSVSFCIVVAFILTVILSSPVPYVANPWLIIGFLGGPAILGALFGQHLGYCLLQAYLVPMYSKLTPNAHLNNALLAKLDAERWIFKAGFFPWLILLIMGNYYKSGSTYLAVIWLVSPAFAYGLFEATLIPARSPKPLRLITLVIGLALPILVSSGIIIRLVEIMVGSAVRIDRNPGDLPEWLPNVVIAAVIGGVSCLTLVFLLSYIHLSGAKKPIIFTVSLLFCATLLASLSGIAPPFTQNVARAVNVVHVVDDRRSHIETEPRSYISVFSITPGKLSKEIEVLAEGFVCGSDKVIDFITFSTKYSCWTSDDSRSGWSESDIPTLRVEHDVRGDDRTTKISINAKVSTRWSLAVNMVEIKDFIFEANFEELVPRGDKSSVDGWHIIQFSGGKDAPKEFYLTLFWWKNSIESANRDVKVRADEDTLLKLRTDVNKVTPETERILRKFPPWCSMFGKSTSPLTFAFLTDFPVQF